MTLWTLLTFLILLILVLPNLIIPTNAQEIKGENEQPGKQKEQLIDCALAMGAIAVKQKKLSLKTPTDFTYAKVSTNNRTIIWEPNGEKILGLSISAQCRFEGMVTVTVQCNSRGCRTVNNQRVLIVKTARAWLVLAHPKEMHIH